MANVQHSALTDPELHEIKGAAAATANHVPIADGAGAAPFGALSYTQLPMEDTALEGSGSNTPGTATGSTTHTVTHGLSSPPILFMISLVCTTAEGNYSVGDEIFIGFQRDATNSIQICIDSGNTTQFKVLVGSSTPTVVNKTTYSAFNVTAGSWNVKVYFWGPDA